MKQTAIIVVIGLSIVLFVRYMNIKDGGDCEYAVLDEKVTVERMTEHVVSLSGITGTYEVKMTLFDSRPKIGELYLASVNRLVDGSCIPFKVLSLSILK